MRGFSTATTLNDQSLTLALASGLTPDGTADDLSFFHGFTTQPQVVARSLVALAEITATRYYNFSPEAERDPILSAHGDRLRAECFSACNGVYACFELFAGALDGGQIGYGTTNVDISSQSRALLSQISQRSLLHLNVGHDGLRATTKTSATCERPVAMPNRWVAALGNVSQIMQAFILRFQAPASGARSFIASLPPASATTRSAWLSAVGQSLKVSQRAIPGSVFFPGVHRLSALKRLLPFIQGVRVFSADGEAPGAVLSVDLPGARMTVAVTEEAWRGFSGEGSLLVSLAQENVRENAETIAELLAFDPRIDAEYLGDEASLAQPAVEAALAFLAASGRVGWDPHASAYFHRELPHDAENVIRANPRLTGARRLLDGQKAHPYEQGWVVVSGKKRYFVHSEGDNGTLAESAECTCRLYTDHAGTRGPCKHILAAMLMTGEVR